MSKCSISNEFVELIETLRPIDWVGGSVELDGWAYGCSNWLTVKKTRLSNRKIDSEIMLVKDNLSRLMTIWFNERQRNGLPVKTIRVFNTKIGKNVLYLIKYLSYRTGQYEQLIIDGKKIVIITSERNVSRITFRPV